MDESDQSGDCPEMACCHRLCQRPATAGPRRCAARPAGRSSRRVSSSSCSERRRCTAISRPRVR